MSILLAVINQKGGAGKSTTALAIAAGLADRGRSVLSVDLDPQGNMSYAMGVDPGGLSALEVLLGEAPAVNAVRSTRDGDSPY